MSLLVNRIASRRAELVLHVAERRQQIDCDKAENHQRQCVHNGGDDGACYYGRVKFQCLCKQGHHATDGFGDYYRCKQRQRDYKAQLPGVVVAEQKSVDKQQFCKAVKPSIGPT